jgi:hypothetical protein
MNQNPQLYSGPIILPLDLEGKIYALQDRFGIVVGTGSRAACEVLIKFLIQPCAAPRFDWTVNHVPAAVRIKEEERFENRT